MTSQQDPAAWRLPEAGGERLMADPGIAEMVAQLHHERGTIRATVRVRRPRIVAPAVATEAPEQEHEIVGRLISSDTNDGRGETQGLISNADLINNLRIGPG